MKIWVQSFNYTPHELGGSERSARELAEGLAERGHQVQVVLSDNSRAYPAVVNKIPIIVMAGLPIGRSPLSPNRSFLSRALWSIRSEIDVVLVFKALRRLFCERPECVLINNPVGHGSALMLGCLIARVPFVPIFRDYGWLCAFGTMTRDARRCDALCAACRGFSVLRRVMMRRAAKIVAISKYTAELVFREVGCVATMIYNSVPESFFSEPKRTQPGCGMKFGYLGRLHSTKGVSELLDGWKKSSAGKGGHKLLIAGGGELQANIEDAMDESIELIGVQPALEFIDSLDVLVVPSTWAEPFGRTVVEAMARGVYVVGSPHGAIPELITDDAGELLPEVSAEAIAECIDRLIATKQFHQAAPVRLAAYQRDSMLDKYERLVESVRR